MLSDSPWFGLGILFTINTINFLDRLSIAAVLTEIKEYYKFDSTQAGLLSTCFLVGYMLTAPIFGYLGDKYSRKWIIIGGIIFWILACFSGSIISHEHKILFFISRMLVGVGEASYSTIAPTIIADLFEPSKRKLGLSIFYFAIPIGSGLGFLTGTLARSLNDWRWIFRITPAVGLVATAFLLFLKEPKRGQTDGAIVEPDKLTVMENVRYLVKIKSYVWATIGFTCCLFASGALSWWAINFQGVANGKDYETTAQMIFGGIICAAGFVGVSLGSYAAQHYRKIDGRADPFVCAFGVFAAVPLTFFSVLLTRSILWLSWILLFLAVTALSTNWAVVSDMLLSVTLPNKRAFATAIQILVSHLLGDASSPFIIGYIKDSLIPVLDGDEYRSFQYALLLTLIILTLGACAFVYSAKFFVQDVEKCKQSIERGGMTGVEIDESATNDAANLTDFAADKQ